MVSLRVSRDRRGYDHIYLIEESRRRGRSEGRLLYWSRLPGGMRVGREPFDEETRTRLERANPGVAFDWPTLTKTLASSLAAARWAARQQLEQQQRATGRAQAPRAEPGRQAPRRDGQRVGARSRGRDEAGETAPDEAGGLASPEPTVAGEPDA